MTPTHHRHLVATRNEAISREAKRLKKLFGSHSQARMDAEVLAARIKLRVKFKGLKPLGSDLRTAVDVLSTIKPSKHRTKRP